MFKKIKSKLFGESKTNTDAELQESVVGAPPVDVNVAVTNPNLSQAIDRVAVENTSEAKQALFGELNKANYLVAIFDDEMHISDPNNDGHTVIEKGSRIKVINATDSEGNMMLPLFTDWEALRAYTDHLGQAVNSMIFPPQNAWSWVLSQDDYRGAVINPAGNALPLDLVLIQHFSSEFQDH